MTVEMRDVAPGLWLWRQPHPDWTEGSDWDGIVASFAVESRRPGDELPGGLRAHDDGRLAMETPLFLPEQRALDFEHVLVSHGEPVHTRADFEAALEREPWSDFDGS